MSGARWRRAAAPLFGLASVLAALALWQAAVAAGLANRFILPPPSEIAQSLPALFIEEGLFARFLQTFAETFVATALAAGAGIPLGWALHRVRILGLAFESWIAAVAAAPLVLLYPLFLVIFGRNAATIIAMGAIAALPAIVLKTKEGLDSTRRVLVDVGRGFGLAPAQLFRRILLPAAAPAIFNGLRLGLIFALINVVGVEFLINFGGMGEIIADLAERFEVPSMYGAILFVVLTSVCFFFLTEKLERWLRPV